MEYINCREEWLTPYIEVKIGDLVIHKNGNGNYYYGYVLTKDIWHDAYGVAGKYKRSGINVNLLKGSSCIFQLKELFVFESIKELIQCRCELLSEIAKHYLKLSDIRRRYDTHIGKMINELTSEIKLLESL